MWTPDETLEITNNVTFSVYWTTKDLYCLSCHKQGAHIDIENTICSTTGWHVSCWISTYRNASWYPLVNKALKEFFQENPELVLEE